MNQDRITAPQGQGNPVPSGPFATDAMYQEEEIDLREYLYVLTESKWLIAVITFVVLFLGAAYAFLATPIYEADALIQIEEKDSGLGSLDDITSLLTGKTPTLGEIEIMRSRSVLGAVVDDLHLDINVRPHRMPLIGAAWARLAGDDSRAVVDRLTVPPELLDKPLRLITGNAGHYRLLEDDGRLLTGEVGKPATGHGISMFVSAIHARPGTRFDVARFNRIEVIQDMQKELKAEEKGKETNIVRLAYRDPDPALATRIVEHIAEYYLRQNVERRSEEARKSLVFLDQQLPKVRHEVEGTEMALKEYRESHTAVDLQEASKALLEQMVNIQRLQSELDVKRSGLRQQFTAQHPVIAAIDARAKRLAREKRVLEARIHKLPKTEQEVLSLMRDAKVKNEMYTFLLNKTQELRVVQAGTVGNARIVDHAAAAPKPVKPKKAMIVALSLTGGLFLGVLAAFVRKSLMQTVDDPNELERLLGITVYAGIPHSDAQVGIHEAMVQRRRKRKPQKAGVNLLAVQKKEEGTIEALRSLRTNLHFAQMDVDNNIVAISGPSAGVGKSFVSANLAYVLADGGKRVLLMDGDLRKGHLHEYFATHRKPGLAEAISGQIKWKEAVHETGFETLSFMPTGDIPPNPSELLMHERFEAILAEASAAFDVVLIDTPPVLAVTDATVIGRYAGTFFLLLRAGHHPVREIQETLRQLQNGGVQVKGALLNDLQAKGGKYGYYGNYYQYGYK